MKKPENPYVFVADALYRFQKMSMSMYFFWCFFYKEGPMKALTLSILGLHPLKIVSLKMISELYLDFTKIVGSFHRNKAEIRNNKKRR